MKLFGLKDENGKEYVLTADNIKPLSNLSPLWDFKVEPIEPTPKFKVGKWYVYSSYIFRVINIDSDWIYFDKENSHVIGEPKMRVFSGWADSCHLATASEIKSHLIKEAERRGFKNNVKYKDPVNERIHKLRFDKLYYWEGDILTDGWGGAIYQDGQWATIIPDKKPLPKTKKELMDLLVHIAVHNSHQHVRETLDEYED